MIARHAAANGLPVELVHRVVIRESGYNPRARNGGNLGLMQIKYATARGVGYAGPASGLMDPETNLTYAVRYLAGAYQAAGGNASRAVALYARGYHGRGVPRATHVAATPWQARLEQW
jgi:soluble lytic murein transglycosylase-like protein